MFPGSGFINLVTVDSLVVSMAVIKTHRPKATWGRKGFIPFMSGVQFWKLFQYSFYSWDKIAFVTLNCSLRDFSDIVFKSLLHLDSSLSLVRKNVSQVIHLCASSRCWLSVSYS